MVEEGEDEEEVDEGENDDVEVYEDEGGGRGLRRGGRR